MVKSMLKSLALITVLGAGSTPIAIFTATLADAAMPIRANSTSATLYISTGLAAVLGFQKDMFESAIDVGHADIDPRLVKSKDVAYALVGRDEAISMIQAIKDVIGRADKDTVLVDPDGYDIIVLDAETLKNEPQYAELLDEPIDENTVLILVAGAAAVQVLRGLDIEQPGKIVIGEDAHYVLETFAEFTLGLTSDTAAAGETSTLDTDQRELVDA